MAPDFSMEYCHPDDEAWYDVSFLCDGEMLTLKYANFSEIFNETFHAGNFKTMEELEDFKERFRLSSVQLQDQECNKIVPGKTVCAAYKFANGEVKFFDAIVVEVLNKEHEFKEGEEQCFCTYVLRWQHGPLADARTFATMSDICLTTPGKQVDSSLASFLKMAQEKIENTDARGCMGTSHEGPSTSARISRPRTIKPKQFFMKLRRQRKFRCASRTEEGKLLGRCKKIEEVMD